MVNVRNLYIAVSIGNVGICQELQQLHVKVGRDGQLRGFFPRNELIPHLYTFKGREGSEKQKSVKKDKKAP